MDAQLSQFRGTTEQSGAMCLAFVAWRLGDRMDETVGKLRSIGARGTTPADLVQAASELGLLGRLVSCEASALPVLPLPCILQLRGGRFVVLERARGRTFKIFDPTQGWTRINRAELAHLFIGFAIELARLDAPKRRRERAAITPLSLVSWSPELTRSTVFAVGAAALVQVYVALGPLYSGLVIDRAVPSNDRGFLLFLTAAFAILAAFNASMTFLRGVAIQQLSTILGWNISRRIFSRLIRLPLEWFQSRQQADVLQKLNSVDQVRQLLTNIATAVAVDGLLVIVTFIMLAVLTPMLALASGLLLIAYIGLRAIAIPIIQQRQSRAIQANIADSGERMEFVRAIQTIKSMAGEANKEAVWSHKFAGNLQASLDTSVANQFFSAVQTAMMLITGLLIYFIGADAVIGGNLTIGTLVAALAYQAQFSQRASFLFEQYMSWRATDVHMARIADIFLTDTERGIDRPVGDIEGIVGALEARSISYRYSITDPFVLEDVSFAVHPGEVVAVTGASGIGKSTLVKLLTGLYAPTQGEVLLDGRPLSSWGPKTVRTAFGMVLQSDELLSGTISENVTFFAAQPDRERLWLALTDAGIADEVAKLPLRENAWVGDMGSSLSGGQKQRLLIARALYKNPRLLVLDEATSHLDVPREQQILAMLRARRKTVVMIAHRPETIAAADRVIRLADGRCRVEAPSVVRQELATA